jgi:hypothetical protein
MRLVRGSVALLALAAACGGLATIDDAPPDPGAPDATDATRATPDAPAQVDATVDASDAGSDADADADATLDASDDAADAADATDAAVPDPPDPVLVRFAVVGDYGNGSGRELLVANLIATWAPEFIVTTGDNDYSLPHDYDETVGKFYHSFIAPYGGAYGEGAAENAFFPAIGNHDWDGDNGASYFDFFTLPGNERYFELDKGPVHFVFLDSDKAREIDGTSPGSTQGLWAQAAIAASAAPFQFVVFHHPAHTSGDRTAEMDWPFKTWGADAVITGHVHNYERLRSAATGLQYFVNGQGGVTTHGFGPIHPSSQLRYNAKDGAQLVEVGMLHARFRYYDIDGTLRDDITLDPTGAIKN